MVLDSITASGPVLKSHSSLYAQTSLQSLHTWFIPVMFSKTTPVFMIRAHSWLCLELSTVSVFWDDAWQCALMLLLLSLCSRINHTVCSWLTPDTCSGSNSWFSTWGALLTLCSVTISASVLRTLSGICAQVSLLFLCSGTLLTSWSGINSGYLQQAES